MKRRKLSIQRSRPVSIQQDPNLQEVQGARRSSSLESEPQQYLTKMTQRKGDYTDNIEPKLHCPVYESCLRPERGSDADVDNVRSSYGKVASSSEDDSTSNAASEAEDISIELINTTPADMRRVYEPVQTDHRQKLPSSDLESEKKEPTGSAMIEHIVPAWLPKKIKKLFLVDRHGGQFTFKVICSLPLRLRQLTEIRNSTSSPNIERPWSSSDAESGEATLRLDEPGTSYRKKFESSKSVSDISPLGPSFLTIEWRSMRRGKRRHFGRGKNWRRFRFQ